MNEIELRAIESYLQLYAATLLLHLIKLYVDGEVVVINLLPVSCEKLEIAEQLVEPKRDIKQ